jgi:hypothetical protein
LSTILCLTIWSDVRSVRSLLPSLRHHLFCIISTIIKEGERHTWVPLAVIGLVHIVATLIHCWVCDLFGLLTLELLICRCITVELQDDRLDVKDDRLDVKDDRLDVKADRRQRFRYIYIYIVVRWQWISGQELASSFLSAQPTAKSTQHGLFWCSPLHNYLMHVFPFLPAYYLYLFHYNIINNTIINNVVHTILQIPFRCLWMSPSSF